VAKRRRLEAAADRVVLTDPKALRALAHPARTAVIDELYQGKVRTASELAVLTGLTPSAMSYHLRALEKWGIVRRAEREGDARERPWQRSARGLSWEGDLATSGTQDAVAGLLLDRLRRDLAAAQSAREVLPQQWREATVVNRGFPWLTPKEVVELTAAVDDLVNKAKDRTEDDHPADARRVAYFLAVAPLLDDAPGSAPTPAQTRERT